MENYGYTRNRWYRERTCFENKRPCVWVSPKFTTYTLHDGKEQKIVDVYLKCKICDASWCYDISNILL